jgi:hypothetical protein
LLGTLDRGQNGRNESLAAPCLAANRIPVLELPFQQAESAQLSGTSRSNDLHNHPRHTARTNTNTSAATTIQINAFCGSGGGAGRGVSRMALPEAS